MGFTKLDEGILQSSIMAADPVTFKVWIALLAACESDGVARIAPTFLASVCRLDVGRVVVALDELASPDPHSRSQEMEGRRVERCDGGWRVINHAKYRGWTYSQTPEAIRQRRHRERDVDVTKSHGGVTGCDVSASASSVVIDSKGGSGGRESNRAVPPEQRAEEATEGAIRRLQLQLGALLTRLSEHANSRLMQPAWCRAVTSFKGRDGPVKGLPDYRLVRSIDRLEHSIEDAEWWLTAMDGGKVVDEGVARGTR